MAESNTRVVVIGGGPAGYAAAFKAADLGMAVTLVDEAENPGGVCLYRGCIPSKALLHVARLLRETREASNWGVTFQEPTIDIDKLRGWKESIIRRLTGGLGQLSKARGITFVQGRAQFLSSDAVRVDHADGSTRELSADAFILATGSRPARIPGMPEDSPNVLDSTGALELTRIPKSLLIIGGGYIGLEMGTVYSALGAKVTVVEMTDGLLPGADRDLVGVLEKQVRQQFEAVLLNTRVASVKALKTTMKVTFDGGDVSEPEQKFEQVMVAVGRRPNSEGLGLENTGVEVGERGFVTVDAQMRTADSRIFAIGDVAGEPMLAHKGSHEGIVAAEVIAGHRCAFEPAAIPGVVFTDPEVAWCGLTEAEAEAQGRAVKVAKFPWGASGRAMTLDRQDGLTKLIIDPDNDRILGVGLCGVGAGELIAEGTLAVEMAALASDLKLTIHPHPTLSETVMEAAELASGSSTHLFRGKS